MLNELTLKSAGVDLSTNKPLAEGIALYDVPGTRAVEIWQNLAKQHQALGGWPLILGDPKNLTYIEEMLDRSSLKNRQAILTDIPTSPPLIALQEQSKYLARKQLEHAKSQGWEYPDILKAHLESRAAEPTVPLQPPSFPPEFNAWAAKTPALERTVHSVFDFDGKPLAKCLFAVILDTPPTDVAAILTFGGYNQCPPPRLQVAFLRDWNRRYGALPIAVTHDVLELYVPHPVANPEETFRIAWEQSQYCDDIVSQGTHTLEKLAQKLWLSNFWYFWWD